MATFAIKFLGCKVSQADAMSARAALIGAGHREVGEDEAELHVINTCCITAEAEAKSRQSVRRSLRQADQVFVSGCAANLNAGQFADIDPRVRPFTGTAEDVAAEIGACVDLRPSEFPGREFRNPRAPGGMRFASRSELPGREFRNRETPKGIREASRSEVPGREFRNRETPKGIREASRSEVPGREFRNRETPKGIRFADSPTPNGMRFAHSTRTRGFVKVQDGCECHCAYCIIPTVRGGGRSRPASAVLREVAARVRAGQPEMVMTGISVGDYRDPERGLELGQLMVEVAHVPGVERVRLSSVEVIHVRDSLIDALLGEPKVCPHLHIPLQSGDDGVLAAMDRHYTADEYLAHVQALRAAVPDVNLTTDVIVGFPTEDEAAFARTLALLDAAAISRVHAFSYSPRPGTAAEALGDRVSPEEKKRRSRELRGRSELRSRLHRAAKLGRVEPVLVDKVADSRCSGYTRDYTRCYLPAGAAARGAVVEALCTELYADGISCEVPQAAGLQYT